MARQSRLLDFTRNIATRIGNEVKFYEIFDGRYINGAYYEASDDVWYPKQWGLDGSLTPDSRDDFDLINCAKKEIT